MIETHCHLTFDTLLAQIDQVLARATAAGVDRLITVSTTPQDAEAAHQLADCDRRIFTTAGVLGTLAWSLVISAIAASAAYLILRKATPTNSGTKSKWKGDSKVAIAFQGSSSRKSARFSPVVISGTAGA